MRTLKANGHTGEEAEDGQIAVDKVKEKGSSTYDAILMDFVMVGPHLLLSVAPSPLFDLMSLALCFYDFVAGHGWTGCYQSHPCVGSYWSYHWLYRQYVGYGFGSIQRKWL